MPGVRLARPPARCCRRSRSTSGSAPPSSTPTSVRRWNATRPSRAARSARPATRADPDHPVAWRRRDDRGLGAARGRRRALRPRRRRRRRRHAARLIGHGDLIPSTWAAPAPTSRWSSDGAAQLAADRRLAGQRVALPALDIASIGAGGGSIARVDAGGVLHVGPRAPAPSPGPPAMAGRHRGDRDRRQPRARLPRSGQLPRRRARLDGARGRGVDRIAGGARRRSHEAAEASIGSSTRTWPRASGWSRCAAASIPGVRDPRLRRRGRAARHRGRAPARGRARDRSAPRRGAVGLGHARTDLRYEVARTHVGDASRLDPAALRAALRRDGGRGPAALAAASFDGPVQVQRSADMRYGEQIFEVNVALGRRRLGGAGPARAAGCRLPPPPRGALHLRHAGPGGRCWSTPVAVIGALPDPPREFPGLLGRPAAAHGLRRSISAAGPRCRSSISTPWRRARGSRGRRHRGGNHDGP